MNAASIQDGGADLHMTTILARIFALQGTLITQRLLKAGSHVNTVKRVYKYVTSEFKHNNDGLSMNEVVIKLPDG